ncbi:isoprenylcysteine carboxyl methyltransferase family protein [Arsenicicoccus sp. oral taxon 190]|uniref:isoprenylcysteine carboxyl methyltransferase family protein n=1 Tax=Arsenicicoccus sp. oral taxon 190 TaxID=1658671 RepID=UPI00067A2600|nr:isoprenylcysteine carboxylmethyltransferase family protein [Arsenicicoccus sp. oral taxon 190]AKT51834.1 membrane protein [Arsenicicoccus sp. oral taxon 190]
MDSRRAYAALVAAVGVERLAELVVSRRNAAWSLARGGRELGQGHYPVMVALHSGLLVASVAEATWGRRGFGRGGWVALGGVAAAQALRWWCIRTLGPQWNTRVIVVPGASRVTTGPYRWLDHPNYVAVVVEGVALPMVHGARWTATGFTLANALLLRHRLRVEEAALRQLQPLA